ncbi:peroxiredoxin family protein [Chloroflexota bacterium]
MGKVLKIIVAMLLGTALILGLVAGCSVDSASTQAPLTGNLAPDFQLPDLDGQAVSLSDFRGKRVLLNFWASWCGPCREEMPFIQEVYENKKWSDKGLVILAVNLGEDLPSVMSFLEAYGLSFPVLLDVKQVVAKEYNIRGIPATFFISEDGVIQDIKIGAFSNKPEIEWRLVNSIISED